MSLDLERYLDAGLRYRFESGPETAKTLEDAMQNGLNCVALAHLVLRDMFGAEIEPSVRCFEMFNDNQRFRDIPFNAPNLLGPAIRVGDLFWFGLDQPRIRIEQFAPDYANDGNLTNCKDFAVKHVGIFTGDDEEGDPLILHASWDEGTNAVWPLSQFAAYGRYRRIYAVRRYKTEAVLQEDRNNSLAALRDF